ncbi:Hypothetical predicted protein [Drosophila guanche]|uniref:Uncharacterized protein n=1 Tax=Drosophila guanche TaxID=7266 RepID=A0A3B0JDG1_DROGU|nr:Hypothetical predicted protein [Drosophila guanche]
MKPSTTTIRQKTLSMCVLCVFICPTSDYQHNLNNKQIQGNVQHQPTQPRAHTTSYKNKENNATQVQVQSNSPHQNNPKPEPNPNRTDPTNQPTNQPTSCELTPKNDV